MTAQVSIIMPVLNGERYIAQAIESICQQTFGSYELLVIDDGSSDQTREIALSFAERLDLKYVRHEANQGIAASVNDGIQRASGAFIAFLDHDDLWLPEFLETQFKYLSGHPDVGMVHSDIQTIDAEGTVLEHSAAHCRRRSQPSGFVFRELFMRSMICGNSVLIRKECFDRLGLWDESLRWADYHMWLRIARHYKVDYVPKVLTAYRQHATQQTRSSTVPVNDVPVGVRAIERLLEEYPEVRQELGDRVVNRRIAAQYFDVAYGSCARGELALARVWLRRALRLWPTNVRYLGVYAATLVPHSPLSAIRNTWRRFRRVEVAAR